MARAIRGWPGSANGPEHSQAIHRSAYGPESSPPLFVWGRKWPQRLLLFRVVACGLPRTTLPPTLSFRRLTWTHPSRPSPPSCHLCRLQCLFLPLPDYPPGKVPAPPSLLIFRSFTCRRKVDGRMRSARAEPSRASISSGPRLPGRFSLGLGEVSAWTWPANGRGALALV